ncbi:MAG: hypothetical protein Q8O67_31260 [Deltaproteobacteria bacterium]|nr:hypothetical protein [Deltaproteobacteria bacterium]
MSVPPAAPAAIPRLDLPSLRKRAQRPRARILALVDADGAFAAAIARPLVVASLVVAGLFAVLPPAAFLLSAHRSNGVDSVLRDELDKSGRLDKIPADQRDQIMAAMVTGTAVALPVGAVAKRWLGLLLCAGLSVAFLRGARPHFTLQKAVAVAVVGAAPLYVHDVITAIAFMHFDLHSIDPQNPVASNPTAWLFSGKETRGPLAVFLRGLDFFELWGCAWIAAGLTRAAGGRTSVPVVVVFGLHLLGMLIATAGAARA